MTVPSSLNTPNATASSNDPQGSEVVFPSLDDYIRSHASFIAQLRDHQHEYLSTVAGTVDAITGTTSSGAPNALSIGQIFWFKASGANTSTTPTININTIGAKTIKRQDGSALVAGDIPASGKIVLLGYDGTDMIYLNCPRVTKADTATTATTATTASTASTASTATVAIDAGYAGDIKHSVQTADHGKWLMSDGRTVGDGSSGATARANADTLSLFTVIWNGSSNTDSPIQDSSGSATTRGASAAADFAAHKRMPIPDYRGMVIKGTPNGGGNTTNPSRANLSYEADGNKSHSHTFAASSGVGATNQISSTASQAPGFVTTSTDGNTEATVRTRAANIFIYLG